MPIRYWYKAGADTAWDTLTGNWWLDANHSQQAPSLPADGDYVHFRGDIAPTSGPSSSLALGAFNTAGLGADSLSESVTANISIQSGGYLTMGNDVSPPPMPGNAHAWGGTTAATGTFSFNDAAYIAPDGAVGDGALFNDSASCQGVAGDYATFHDTSYGSGSGCIIGDYAIFGDSSYCDGGTVGDYYVVTSTEFFDYQPLSMGLTAPLPAESDVRSGETFGQQQTGTCVVPDAASVLFTVPVDDTTGSFRGIVDIYGFVYAAGIIASNGYYDATGSLNAEGSRYSLDYVLTTAGGTLTLPAAANVWYGSGAYGVGGTGSTPSKRASSITNCVAGNVKNGVAIDNVTGTYVSTSLLPVSALVV